MSTGQRRCGSCGSGWFTTAGITLSSTGEVIAYSSPVHCSSCGHVLSDAAPPNPPPVPDARSTTREKARHLAETEPGTWVPWKTYTADQMLTARVAASDLRTGKIKTVDGTVGQVDARTVRLPDGTIRVDVTRTPPA